MKKIFKLMAWVIIVIPVLLITLALVIPRFIDPNDYRQQITDLVREKTDRELSIDGEMAVSLFPWVGVRVQDVSLAQPESVGAGSMVSVAEADLRVKVLPLLKKVVEVDTIILRQPIVNMVVLADGSSSADGLVPAADTTSSSGSPDTPAPVTPTAPAAAGTAVALAVHGVVLEGGKLIWDDRANQRKVEISDLEITAGELLGENAGEFLITGIYSEGGQKESTSFRVNGLARVDPTSLDTIMADITLEADSGDRQHSSSIGLASISEHGQRVEVTGINAGLDVGAGIATVDIGALTLDQERQTLSIPQISLKLGGMEAGISVSGTSIMDAPQLTGSVTTNDFSVAQVLKIIESDYSAADPAALQSMRVSANYSATSTDAQIENLDVVLDDSTLVGSLGITDFENPAYEFDLKLDAIDIDRYLPPVAEGERNGQQAQAGAALVLPIALFRDLTANGQFSAQQLVAGGMRVEMIELLVESLADRVTVTPSAQLYGGTLGGSMEYTKQGDSEQLAIVEAIENVQLGDLLSDIGVTDRLTGTGSLHVDLTVLNHGDTQENNGVIRVLARDGALKGVDIKKILDRAEAAWKRSQGDESDVQQGNTDDETRFAELSGTFNLADLNISNDDLTMKAPAFRVAGRGDIDLAVRELDYLVSLSVVNTSDGQGGAERSDLAGLTIPVRFTGALDAPAYSIDIGELLRAAAQGAVDEEREKFEEKLNEKINEGLNKLFR